MNSFIKAMSKNNSRTHNQALTHSSSDSAIVDMFFLFGALRNRPDEDVITVFDAAMKENSEVALKLLGYFRDIEEGMGERRAFRLALTYLYDRFVMRERFNHIIDNVDHFITSNIARVDDFIYLANYIILKDGNKKNEIVDKIIMSLFTLMNDKNIGKIVAKWMPRKGSKYGKVVQYMRKHDLILSYGTYRRAIAEASETVEQQMSKKEWKDINLSHVPSIAMKKYKKAFDKHGILKPFLDKLDKGEASINAKRLTPADVVIDITRNYYDLSMNDKNLLNHQWENLKTLDSLPQEFRALPMIDVSESMFSPKYIPIANSVGIGLFMAENNPNEAFRNHFITFTNVPRFQKITGHDIYTKVKNAMNTIGYNTNIEAAFDLILNRALQNNVPAEEMPTHLVIISDMEFDDNYIIDGTEINALQMMDNKYNFHGYERPQIVFWNVDGRLGNIPAKDDDRNVVLVSGSSQNAINFILKKQYEDVYGIIDEIVNSERYGFI